MRTPRRGHAWSQPPPSAASQCFPASPTEPKRCAISISACGPICSSPWRQPLNETWGRSSATPFGASVASLVIRTNHCLRARRGYGRAGATRRLAATPLVPFRPFTGGAAPRAAHVLAGLTAAVPRARDAITILRTIDLGDTAEGSGERSGGAEERGWRCGSGGGRAGGRLLPPLRTEETASSGWPALELWSRTSGNGQRSPAWHEC